MNLPSGRFRFGIPANDAHQFRVLTRSLREAAGPDGVISFQDYRRWQTESRAEMDGLRALREQQLDAHGFDSEVLWHGGGFDPEAEDTPKPWMHMGTFGAAQARVNGSGLVESLIAQTEYFEDDGEWRYSIAGDESMDSFRDKGRAEAAGMAEIQTMFVNLDAPDAVFTEFRKRGDYPEVPDLITWPIEEINAAMPKTVALNPTELQTVMEAGDAGLRGLLYGQMLEERGVAGFSYFNKIEDKRSRSVCVFSPNNAALVLPPLISEHGKIRNAQDWLSVPLNVHDGGMSIPFSVPSLAIKQYW